MSFACNSSSSFSATCSSYLRTPDLNFDKIYCPIYDFISCDWYNLFVTLRKMRYLFVLILCAACASSGKKDSSTLSVIDTNRKPLVAISVMEDLAKTPLSSHAAKAFTKAVFERLHHKNRLHLTRSKAQGRQFLVTMQLVRHQEISQEPNELAISILLKILDTRTEKPQVVLQEDLSLTTLFEKPLTSWNDEAFRISPMGLAHSKLSREIASRIEDYILLREQRNNS